MGALLDSYLLFKEYIGYHSYTSAIVTFIVLMIIIKIFKDIFIRKLKKIVHHTRTRLDDVLVDSIADIGWPLYFLLAMYISMQFLGLPQIYETIVAYALLLNVTYYFIKGLQRLIDFGINEYIFRKHQKEPTADASEIKLIGKIMKFILWVVAFIFILSNLGYNVSTLIAGFGIGGIAIAFALQNVLADIFASFSIFFDKPFEIGDFITIGEDMGTVEKIGIKTTRLRTLKGQELVISNKELTESRINNFKKMQKRRIVFSFGVTYETPTAKMRKIPSIIKKIIEDLKITKIDRVTFKEFADSSLTYEVVYYINSNNYNKYMETQQDINLKIKEQFEKLKINLAYPTRTLYLKK